MYEKLKTFCKQTIPFSDAELGLIDHYFEDKSLKKGEYLLESNKVCDFIAFITKGAIRHFHIKDGVERTCDISFDNSWVTDFQSFNHETAGMMNLQAMENTTVALIKKQNLLTLYQECSKYETFGRLMAERVAQRATDIAMSLSADKPEERFQNLLREQPDLFQRVPQRFIANLLGVSPESLSRIKNRVYHKRQS
ncbi:Crp/Fnr family transcriptional regulator [Ekhidna sp.]|uniref:Crp/Fnr family transcriptional regulator n=1 Tax=Ekhidna sp. TaxID=2608089 RepID=UPI0032EFE77E